MSTLDSRSRYLRRLIVSALEGAKKGHVGSALSSVEIIRVLYDDIMTYKADDPDWPDRDRFILSKGHGCLSHYAVLADKGFISADELKTYTLPGSRLGGCSERLVPGVEATTGSLGHGLPIGIGMALAARMQKRRSRVYVVLGDGELNEGSVWEAFLAASHHKLTHLTIIIDRNRLQLSGPTKDIADTEPLADKLRCFGFAVTEIDGHSLDDLRRTFAAPQSGEKPPVVICHTVKGKGLPFAENEAVWHWKGGIDAELVARMMSALEEPVHV